MGGGERKGELVQYTCSPWMMIFFEKSYENGSCTRNTMRKYNPLTYTVIQLISYYKVYRLTVELGKTLKNYN